MASHNENEPMQLDWDNREYISAITNNIKKVANVLNAFGMLFYSFESYTSLRDSNLYFAVFNSKSSITLLTVICSSKLIGTIGHRI